MITAHPILRLGRTTRPAIPLIAGALLVMGVAACSAGPSGPQTSGDASTAAGPLPVVTPTTVFADMVANVGGDLVTVRSLVPKGGDVHTYETKPSDTQALSGARLVVMNGLGLDDWLRRTLTAAAPGTPLLVLGEGLPGVALLPGETPDTQNPHLWLDVTYAEKYVDRIEAALASADPAHAAAYQANAAAYRVRLDALDAEVRAKIATIPAANRKLVTFHDAFPYYAREYGITVVGVAVEAPGQDPSAAYTARLIDAMREAGVKAIFSEAQFPTKLIDALAAETGATVVSNLYDDTVGDPPVTSYEAIIRWDTDQLVAALR